MKKAICTFLSLCLIMPLLLIPQGVSAEEESKNAEFTFQSGVWNTTEEGTAIPETESWHLNEKAELQGIITFPFINEENIDEYEIVDIQTSNPDILKNLRIGTLALSGFGEGETIFFGDILKEEYFTLTVSIQKGNNERYTFSSPAHIYKQKHVDLHICAGPEIVTSMDDVFKQEDATELKLNQMYYIYPTIEGFNQNEVKSTYDFSINGQEMYYDQIYTTDTAMYYGFNDYEFLRSAVAPTIGVVAFKANKETAIDVEASYRGSINGIPSSSDALVFKQYYFFSNAKDMQDETGNVEVSAGAGVLPSDASLQVKDYKEDVLADAMKEIAEKYQAYDISISSNGQTIQPNGMVTVRMRIPSGYKKEMIAVYYVDKKGNLTLLKSTIDGDYIVFETNHFSVYAIVEEKQNDSEIIIPPTGGGGEEETTPAPVDEEKPVKKTDTQDSTSPMGILMMTMMISISGIYLVRRKVKE